MSTISLRLSLLFIIIAGWSSALYSQVVGSIPGSFSTNSSGAIMYTIPIECPSGVKGMQPNLSLTYNSLSGNGIAGWGWNITGLSAIMRTPKTKYYDAVEKDIQWTKEDPMTLDGQRLIVFKQWTDSIEYRLEADPTVMVRAYGINEQGASYLKAFTKSGLTMTYGNPAVSSSYVLVYGSIIGWTNVTKAGWSLVEVQDANGNFMKMEYANNNINKISYGGNKKAGTTSELSVNFMYTTRSDKIHAFISGRESQQQYRLTQIRAAVNGVTQKEYRLSYETATTSRLNSITLYDRGIKQYEPLEFTYGEEGTAGEFATPFRETDKKPFIITADFNGDGHGEIWTENYPSQLQSIQGLYGDFNGNGSVDRIQFLVDTGDRLSLSISDTKAGNLFSEWVRYSGIDAIPFATVGSFTGTPLANLIIIYDNPELVSGKHKYRYDMIVRRPSDGEIIRYIKDMFFTLPSKIQSVSAYKSSGLNYRDDLWLILEDGTSRIMKNTQGDYECFSTSELIDTKLNILETDTYSFGDYNGDGLLDVIFRKNSNTWKVALNRGDMTYFVKTLPSQITCTKDGFKGEKDRVFIMDINNDNLPDIVTADEQDTTQTLWRFYRNQGGDTFTAATFEFVSDRAVYSCWGDLRGMGNVTWGRYNSNKQVVIKDFGYTRNNNLLTKVKSPTSPDLTFKYKPQSKCSYNRGVPLTGMALVNQINAGYMNFWTSMIPVISETNNGRDVISYDYGVSLSNWKHRGYMGFMECKEYNRTTDQRVESSSIILGYGTNNVQVPFEREYFIGETSSSSFREERDSYKTPLGREMLRDTTAFLLSFRFTVQ